MVTYHPQRSVLENIDRLVRQFDDVIVVDNTPGGFPLPNEEFGELTIHANERNEGLAKAMNIGVLIAKRRGARAVAFFDQDSVTSPRFLERMRCCLSSDGSPSSVGILAANWGDALTDPPSLGPLTTKTKCAITSGSLIPMDVFEACGLFCEPLMVDQVDFEFCLRVRELGWRVLYTKEVLLVHRVGCPVEKSLLGVMVHPSRHQASRYFYFGRNLVWMLRRYLIFDPQWCFWAVKRTVCQLTKALLFEESRLSKLRNYCAGAISALVRNNPIPRATCCKSSELSVPHTPTSSPS
jgi:rhamnosyltransferase